MTTTSSSFTMDFKEDDSVIQSSLEPPPAFLREPLSLTQKNLRKMERALAEGPFSFCQHNGFYANERPHFLGIVYTVNNSSNSQCVKCRKAPKMRRVVSSTFQGSYATEATARGISMVVDAHAFAESYDSIYDDFIGEGSIVPDDSCSEPKKPSGERSPTMRAVGDDGETEGPEEPCDRQHSMDPEKYPDSDGYLASVSFLPDENHGKDGYVRFNSPGKRNLSSPTPGTPGREKNTVNTTKTVEQPSPSNPPPFKFTGVATGTNGGGPSFETTHLSENLLRLALSIPVNHLGPSAVQSSPSPSRSENAPPSTPRTPGATKIPTLKGRPINMGKGAVTPPGSSKSRSALSFPRFQTPKRRPAIPTFEEAFGGLSLGDEEPPFTAGPSNNAGLSALNRELRTPSPVGFIASPGPSNTATAGCSDDDNKVKPEPVPVPRTPTRPRRVLQCPGAPRKKSFYRTWAARQK